MKDLCEMESIQLSVNGEFRSIQSHRPTTLLDVLRDDLDLTGAKRACDDRECGSCFVLLGDKPVLACAIEASRCQGKEITTIEGLAKPGEPHPLQQAFLQNGATQCGYCIPGMIIRSEALLRINDNPSREQIVKSLSKNLCRCTGYIKIFEAVEEAAAIRRGEVTWRNSRASEKSFGIGVSIDRLDSPGTVDGSVRYAADIKVEDALEVAVLRSPHDHANILNLDTKGASGSPGVKAVLTAADVPGVSYLSNCQPQTRVFAKNKVRMRGEVVAVVAARSLAEAEAALDKIAVEYEPLESVTSIDDGLDPAKPPLFDGQPNCGAPFAYAIGNADKAFATSYHIEEDVFETARRDHAPMETDAAIAHIDDNGTVVVRAALYHPFIQGQKSIARTLGVDDDKVRVVCPPMGGNFGKRGDALAATIVALIAQKTGLPTRIVFSRTDMLLSSSKTPSTRLRYKIGVSQDGRITAMQAEVLRNMGTWAPYLRDATTVGTELTVVESQEAVLNHITGPYEVPNLKTEMFDIVTNAPRSVPLRGTSGGYLPLAIETLLDRIAQKLDIDPIELRLRNVLDNGSRTHMGQVFKEAIGLKSELKSLTAPFRSAKEARERTASENRGQWRRGLGIGCGFRSITYVNMPNIKAGAELLDSGRVAVLAGSVEQGQGCTTEFAQIASEALSLPMEMVEVIMGDTARAPYSVPTYSSVTTLVTGRAILNAVEALKRNLISVAAEALACDRDDIVLSGGFALDRSDSKNSISFAKLAPRVDAAGIPRRHEGAYVWNGSPESMQRNDKNSAPDVTYGFNAALAEVDVNVDTGQVRISKITNAADPGQIINPIALEGQIHGGLAFGIGIALSEGIDPAKPNTFRDYGLPTTFHIPDEIVSICVDEKCEQGPFGAKSAAEMSVIAPVPAIINAIADATGVRIKQIPATPSVVMEALKAQNQVS